jgi:hypothetical protein
MSIECNNWLSFKEFFYNVNKLFRIFLHRIFIKSQIYFFKFKQFQIGSEFILGKINYNTYDIIERMYRNKLYSLTHKLENYKEKIC